MHVLVGHGALGPGARKEEGSTPPPLSPILNGTASGRTVHRAIILLRCCSQLLMLGVWSRGRGPRGRWRDLIGEPMHRHHVLWSWHWLEGGGSGCDKRREHGRIAARSKWTLTWSLHEGWALTFVLSMNRSKVRRRLHLVNTSLITCCSVTGREMEDGRNQGLSPYGDLMLSPTLHARQYATEVGLHHMGLHVHVCSPSRYYKGEGSG